MSLFEQTNTFAGAAVGPLDAGRSTAAAALARGTARLLRALGFCTLSELPLASGRRADLVGLGADGAIVIVEVKSSTAGIATGCSSQRRWAFHRRFFQSTPASSWPTALAPLSNGTRPNTGSRRGPPQHDAALRARGRAAPQ